MNPSLTARGILAVLITAAVLAGCGDSGEDTAPTTSAPAATSEQPASTTPPPSGTGQPRLAGVVAEDLEIPWGLTFLPDGSALVAERRSQEIKRIAADGRLTSLGIVPGVQPGGEGGLLGLAIAPDFDRTPWVYAYFSSPGDNRIVRMRYQNGQLGTPDLVLTGIPRGGNHNGGRIAFGPDGMLYATAGETGNPPLAQDVGSLGGKILRMTPDGDPAPGNPFDNSVVWSYGHRNPQGIGWDEQGRMWAAEFGQNTWDELNLIEPGRNYGWPEVEGIGDNPDYVNPVAQWSTDEASPSGIAVADGAVWMAALRGARLWRIPLTDDGIGTPKAYFVNEFGRLRTVEVAPDGSLWLTTSNRDGRERDPFPAEGDDKVLRIVID